MFERAVLVHYHEIGLKGRNRVRFENILKRNLQAAVGGLTDHKVTRIASRLLIRLSDHSRCEEVIDRVTRVPGISYVADALITARDMAELEDAAVKVLREAGDWETFRIEARRSNTDFPISSQEMNVQIGSHIVEEFSKGVDLSNPEATCWIEVVQGDAYVYSRREQGPGGLPVGSGGRVVSLLSTGIDSPVATWRLMRRGAVVIGVHFSGAPQTDEGSIHLVHEIGETLAATQGLARIHSVRFGDVQREISLDAPPALRVLLYRRLMIRVAEDVAAKEKALALVTGESLGQVASQTLENIAAVDQVATLPILRPLVGTDKLEITRDAERIGTYESSIRPAEDCCTLFMPRMPATRATVEQMLEAEEGLQIDRLVAEAVETITVRDFSCPAYKGSRKRATSADSDRVDATS